MHRNYALPKQIGIQERDRGCTDCGYSMRTVEVPKVLFLSAIEETKEQMATFMKSLQPAGK